MDEQQPNQNQTNNSEGGTNTILIVLLIIIVLVVGFVLFAGLGDGNDAPDNNDGANGSVEIDLNGDDGSGGNPSDSSSQ